MFDIEDFYLKGTYGESISLVKALLDAHRRGVYIVFHLNGFKAEREDVPITEGQLRPLKPVVHHLLQCGIEVLLVYYHESHFSPLHHKFAIFDEHTVITESYNWYSASLYSDEVFSVIRNKDLAGKFIEEMYLMLKSFRIRRGAEMFS
jgi:phosphatidylserine/phosphatidylglycerophosphate/cardiolipin synthase-like enzyme